MIPLVTIAIALLGGYFSSCGLRDWYKTLELPSFAPPGQLIGAAWSLIYVLATISALIFWNQFPRNGPFSLITFIFIANAILNVFWSYLFFIKHALCAATVESAIMDITVVALVVLIWPASKTAGLLLLPYAAWVAFATFLNFLIWRLNK